MNRKMRQQNSFKYNRKLEQASQFTKTQATKIDK